MNTAVDKMRCDKPGGVAARSWRILAQSLLTQSAAGRLQVEKKG